MGAEPQLILGLDLSRPASVRLVLAVDDGTLEPDVLERQQFRCHRRFQTYWERHLAGRRVRVATGDDCSGHTVLLEWLEANGAKVGVFSRGLSVKALGSYLKWELPPSFDTAYLLALLSCYEANAASALALLKNNAVCIRELMNESELHRSLLSAVLR